MKKKLLLSFPKNLTGKPITYNLIKNFDIKLNILKADVDFNVKGTLLIDIESVEENLDSGIKYLIDSGVKVEILNNVLNINEDDCVNCGACTAICAVEALKMDNDWKLNFNPELCLDCKLCLKACPTRAITSIY